MDPVPFDRREWSPSELRRFHHPHGVHLQQQPHHCLHQYERLRRDHQLSTPTRELFRPYQQSSPPPSGSATAPRCGRLPSIAVLLKRSRQLASSRSPVVTPVAHSTLVHPAPTLMSQQRVYSTGEGLVSGIGTKRSRQEDRADGSKRSRSTSASSLGAQPHVAGREAASTTVKQSRYLREMDRRNILTRLARGERQADLAKEFHVSRAAICNLNKHRDVVLSRQNEHPLAKHPKRRGYKKVKALDASPALSTARSQ